MEYFLGERAPSAVSGAGEQTRGFVETPRVVWAADEKANALNGGPKTVRNSFTRPANGLEGIRPMIRPGHMARGCVRFKAHGSSYPAASRDGQQFGHPTRAPRARPICA